MSVLELQVSEAVLRLQESSQKQGICGAMMYSGATNSKQKLSAVIGAVGSGCPQEGTGAK
jgi:hypothetical protein